MHVWVLRDFIYLLIFFNYKKLSDVMGGLHAWKNISQKKKKKKPIRSQKIN